MALATPEDVATRLGRELDTVQAGTVESLLDAAAAVIADAAGRTDAWITALDPAPRILHHLAVELVCRVMNNPAGAAAVSEQLGAYQQTTSWRTGADTAMALTALEERQVRRAVHGQASGSVRIGAIVDDLWCS